MSDQTITFGRQHGFRAVAIKTFVVLVRLALALLIVLILFTGFVAWRLSQGEVDLQPLRPALETLIRRHVAAEQVSIGSIAIAWDGSEHLLEVVARDIDVREIEGRGDLSIARLEFALDVKTLIFNATAAPRRVSIDRPEADIALSNEQADDRPSGGEPLIDLAHLGNVLKGGSATVPEMASLRSVEINNGKLAVSSEGSTDRFLLDAIDMTVDLTASEPVVDLTARLEQSGKPAQLTVHSSPAAGGGKMDLTLSADGVIPAEMATIWPNDVLEDLDQAWSFDARTVLDLEADGQPKLEPIAIELSSDRPASISTAYFEHPVNLEAASLKASLAGDFEKLVVDAARVQVGDVTVEAHGSIAWSDGVNVDLQITSDAVGYQDVLALWPLTAAEKGREWVAENLRGGTAKNVVFKVNGPFGDLDKLPADALHGEFGFEAVEIEYLSTVPTAAALAGTATINLDELQFNVDSGHTGEVKLESGMAVLSKLRVPDEPNQVSVKLDLTTDLPGALRYLAHEPFNVQLPNDVKPEATTGEVAGKVDLSLPTADDLERDDVKGTIDLQLEKIEIPGVQDGFDLSTGLFKVHDDGDTVTLDGTANINGTRSTISLVYHIDASQPPALRLDSRLNPADLGALGVDTGDWVDGPLTIRVDATDFDAPETGFTLAVDLEEAAITAPALGEIKAAGAEGKLNLHAVIRDQQIRIDKATLTTQDMTVSGSALVHREPTRLDRLSLDPVETGKTDMTLSIRTMDDGSYTVDIAGKALDLSPLLRQGGSDDATSANPPEIPPIVVNVDLKEVYLGGRPLPDVKAFFRRSGPSAMWATLTAHNPFGDKLEITLAPEEKTYRLIGSFDDLGGVIEVLGSDERYVRGGKGTLDMVLDQPPPAIQGSGSLKITSFRLVNTPVLARLFSLASLTGIRDLLRGKGLHFDILETEFSVDDSQLTLTRGRLAGSQVGATAKGTFEYRDLMLNIEGTLIPVQGLNSVLASIPIIGRVLSGRAGGGAFVATYSVRGPASDPSITVNPLSVIVPGMIRDIFGDAMALGGERKPVPSGR